MSTWRLRHCEEARSLSLGVIGDGIGFWPIPQVLSVEGIFCILHQPGGPLKDGEILWDACVYA
jgi:hypothetical protein